MKIQLILGSTRPGRLGEQVARWLLDVGKEAGAEVELIDLRDWPLPFFDESAPPSALKGNYSLELAKRWSAKIREGDACVLITPEYNHGYPAVLKNALDYLYDEWAAKPVAFVGYSDGLGAGIRAVEQLKQVVLTLKMVPIYASLTIPNLTDQFDGSKLTERAQKLFADLIAEVRLRTKKNPS